MPLHLRLTALYVGLATLLVAVFGVVVYLDAQAFYLQSAAARVREQARPVITQVLAGGTDPGRISAIQAEALRAALTGRETSAVVLDREGRVLAGERETPGRHTVLLPPGPEGGASHIASDGARRILVVAVPLRAADGSLTGSVELLTPLDVFDEVLRRQRQLVLAGILLTVIAGTAGGLWLTTTSLAPLRKMIARCSRIAAGDFTGRLNRTGRTDDEVGRLAAAFDEMAERIEATLAAHRRFIADASHELRTPLTAISGLNEVLLRGGQDDPESADRLAHAMYRQVKRLRRLAERLLDLARLDTPLAARPRELDLGAFFWDFLPAARALAPGRDISLRAGPPLIVSADEDLLEQALFDLLENAHRYSDPGAPVELGWSVAEGSVEIWVADHGEGIPAEDLPRIFEPLYRSERSRSSATGGAGLGLAIVQGIIHAHGGRIRAESAPGEGARFVITLPLAGAAAPEPGAAAEAAAG